MAGCVVDGQWPYGFGRLAVHRRRGRLELTFHEKPTQKEVSLSCCESLKHSNRMAMPNARCWMLDVSFGSVNWAWMRQRSAASKIGTRVSGRCLFWQVIRTGVSMYHIHLLFSLLIGDIVLSASSISRTLSFFMSSRVH